MTTTSRPTSTPAEGSWQSRPALSWALRIVSVIAPVVGSIAITWVVSKTWDPPIGLSGRIVWWLCLVIIATGSLMAIDRIARRLVPLATLFRMSLIFPDAAPSRFAVAMRTGTTKQLERKLRSAEKNGAIEMEATEAQAAESMLELVAALSEHDRFTRGHGERVRAYTALIGEQVGLDDVELSKLQWAGLIHDIGKLAVPSEILNKPGRLTDEEFEIIKTHPAAGDRMIEPMRAWLGEWADAVVQHHERIDGKGYPAGLRGDQISYGAKIVSVADTFDVITAARSYKSPMSAELAKAELTKHAGTQFDEDIVRAFLNVSIGRLRLAMGPLSLISNLPYLGALTAPAASTATAVVVGATAALGGGVALSSPFEEAPVAIAMSEAVNETTTTTAEVAVVLTETTAEVNASSTPPTSERFPATTTTAQATSSTVASSTATTARPTTTAQPAATTAPTTPATTAAPTPCESVIAGEGDLRNADLTGCNMSGLTLDGRSFADADLSGANLANTTITNSNFTNADLTGANLNGADISDGTATGANFTNANATGATFTNFEFTNTDLTNATFTNATFTNSSLGGSTLIDAKLNGLTLVNSDLNTVNATRATFVGAQLTGAAMADATFTSANFTNAKLTATDLARSNFTSAMLTNTLLDSSGIQDTIITSATMTGADMWAASGWPVGAASATWNNTKCPNGVTGSANCFP